VVEVVRVVTEQLQGLVLQEALAVAQQAVRAEAVAAELAQQDKDLQAEVL
jgi:hypothetical protein